MIEKCPHCGAPLRRGMVDRYECGSTFIPGQGIKHESKACLRWQNADLRKQIKKLEEPNAK